MPPINRDHLIQWESLVKPMVKLNDDISPRQGEGHLHSFAHRIADHPIGNLGFAGPTDGIDQGIDPGLEVMENPVREVLLLL